MKSSWALVPRASDLFGRIRARCRASLGPEGLLSALGGDFRGEKVWASTRGAEVDQFSFWCRLRGREILGDCCSQGPDILWAQAGVVDASSVIGARRLANTGQVQCCAHLIADGPPGLAVQLRPECQILDILLAPPISLEADRKAPVGTSCFSPARPGAFSDGCG